MIIEKFTNNLLSSEFQKRIFTPLKMNDSYLEGFDDINRKPVDNNIIPNSSFAKSALKKDKVLNFVPQHEKGTNRVQICT